MESESAKPASSAADAVGSRPSDETSRKQAEHETKSSSSSSFRGLVGGPSGPSPDSSFGELRSGPSDAGQTLGLGQSFGRYQIRKILGSGSMGSVFLAHDSQLDRKVALKVPRLDHDSTGELSQRLYREARAAATLNHPNICPIYDVSEHEGMCFIAMGYVSGQPLSAYADSKKRQPEREAAKVVRKVALALQEAHAQGILHRDLKPTNIMIDKRGEPIVMDFGVACWFADQTQTRLTQQGALVGTPAYMSPEQIEGRTKLGPACDVYSLGVLLYQILTGRCPFEGTVLNVISQVLHKVPPDATDFRPDLSPELVAICNRAMRKDPAERFPSMLDFAKALTAFLNDATRGEKPRKEASALETIELTRLNPARRASAVRQAALPALPRRTGRSRQTKKSRTNWIPGAIAAASVTALLVVGGLIGAIVVRGGGTPEVAADHELATRAGDPAPAAKTAESPIAVRPAPPSGSPATSVTVSDAKAAPGSSPVAVPNNMLAPKAASSVSPAPVVSSPSSANTDSQPRMSLPGPTVPSISQPSTVSQPAAPLSPAATGPLGDSPPRAVVGPASVSAPSPADARSGNSDSGSPGPPANDDLNPPLSKQARRGMGREPPEDGPPPEGPGGRRPFDGGPAKGTTIEAYFKKLDTNGDGKLDPTEIPLHVISRADSNKDGELSLRELQQAFKKRGQKLFSPPTPAEMRRLPRGGPQPPWDGPEPPDRRDRPGGPGGF
ncbi:MAG TPA: protein kinase [Planctomycetaceae bacterium]|jgi:serine/threonine-protein kinase|nr:protein kinase [Planctomycetaceae bacterium]